MYLWEQELRDDATIIIENHWLINYIDTEAKGRHLKKLVLRQVFIRVYRLVGIFDQAL
jgi:hypothetical protein